MARCTKCGANFFSTPEQPPSDGLCKSCEIEELKTRVQTLTVALRDALSTYGPKDEVVVTAERQEAWEAVLRRCGWKETE